MATFIATPAGSFVPLRSVSPSRCCTTPSTRVMPKAKLSAILFDCDGVLADTERDAHRVAFNLAFAERGLPDVWDEALYGKLLETGGGKERMTAYWNSKGEWPEGLGGNDEGQKQLVKQLHSRKTELFMELVDAGKVPLRPGVQRLFAEARKGGIVVSVCSTSNEKAVQKIVDMIGEDAKGVRVFAGDVVEKKKPAPDIYLLAVKELGLGDGVVVIEDSAIGVKAAKGAGLSVVVTKSTYTGGEDFEGANWVVESLEQPFVGVAELEKVLEGGVAEEPKFQRLRRRFGSRYL